LEAAFALLLPLVAGYLYVSNCNRLKYKASRDGEHRLYFRVAYYGLLLFLLASALLWCLYSLLSDVQEFQEARARAIALIKPLLKEPDKAESQIGFFLICVVSVVLGRCFPYLDNVLPRGSVEQAVTDAASQDDLEMLLVAAAVQYKTISVTTSSNKVYVGLVLQTGEPRTDRRVIALLPFMSGYRTELGKVIFTTFYDEIYEERAKERDDDESNDFRLILPIDKVLSVSFFDVKVYEAFNAKGGGKLPPPKRVKVHKPFRTRRVAG
jgi:hypothetical protein